MSNRALVKDTLYQSLTPITTSYNQLLYTSNTININIKFKHSNISKIICNQGFNQVRKHVPNIEAGAAIGTSTKIEAGEAIGTSTKIEAGEAIGIQPPKGVLLHGPGTGTLLARACANQTRPFRVVRYQLRISCGPPLTFYKDDGGMRNNHMTVKVELFNPLQKTNEKHKMTVPLKCKLITEHGKEIIGTMKKKSSSNNNDNKSRPPLHYLQLHEDYIIYNKSRLPLHYLQSLHSALN
eukprot:380314_1